MEVPKAVLQKAQLRRLPLPRHPRNHHLCPPRPHLLPSLPPAAHLQLRSHRLRPFVLLIRGSPRHPPASHGAPSTASRFTTASLLRWQSDRGSCAMLLPAVRARTRMRAAAGEFPHHFLAASLLLLNLRRRRRRRQGMRVRDMPLRTVPGRVQVMTPLLLSQYASRCSLLLSIFMLLFLSALLLQTSDLPALIGWEQACGEPKRTPRPGRPVNPAEPPQLAEPVPTIGQSGPPPERAARRAGIGRGLSSPRPSSPPSSPPPPPRRPAQKLCVADGRCTGPANARARLMRGPG